jgi:hypothetical protein
VTEKTERERWVHTDAPYNGETRQKDGLTVFASNEARRRSFARREMRLQDALLEIVMQIGALGPGWKIDCISSPSTIWTDLRGIRTHTAPGRSSYFGDDAAPYPRYPEPQLLGRVGRRDLFRTPQGQIP